MQKLITTFLIGILVIPTAFFMQASASDKVTVTTSPQTAKIYVDGILMGAGKVVVKISKNSCVTVDVKQDGYIPETRTYCDKKGITDPPSSEYIQLQEDEAFSSSTESNIANIDVQLSVNPSKTKEEAWKEIVGVVLEKFDDLENSDEKTGYLRTSWVGMTFKSNTLRVRFIVKQSSESPLIYRAKFVSESSGKPGTPYNADEQYKAFNRILKKYDGFMDELTTKLKN